MKNQIENKICHNCQKKFTIEPDDFGFYGKMQVPPPTRCPECRQQLRTIFRNFKTLYKRPSSKSGKAILAVYGPDALFPVYDIAEWWADDWDPMSYGMEIDFNQPFFAQLAGLFNKVPHMSLVNVQSENCEYSNQVLRSKNCYLVFGAVDDEDCDYGHVVWNSRESVDNLYLFKCESCYQCVDCLGSAKLFYSQECEGCVDSIGLFDCRNCTNCIGCVGQINKSYFIFNKQVTKEEYKEFLFRHPLNDKKSVEYILSEREKLRREMPQRSFFGSHNNDVSGNHIYNSRNIHDSFDIKGGENAKFCFTARKAMDSYDISFTAEPEECYQALTVGRSSKVFGSENIMESHDIYYSEYCYNCDNLFGCHGLRKKSYCIFNKQYSKKEYLALKEKIIEHLKEIGEWGNFLPKELSPFAYNEAIVNEYMPLGKEEALRQGFRWKDDKESAKGQGTINYTDLPKNSEDYTKELLAEVLTCEKCQKNYRLIEREINFYRKNKLPLPEKCFNCRHEARMHKRNPRSLSEGICAKCGNVIQTSYRLEDQKKYKIYCEKCYQQEVY